MSPHHLLTLHLTRLAALTRLELLDPGLGCSQPYTEMGYQALELGHCLLEVPELTTRGTRGGVVRTLEQVSVMASHQPGVLEVALKVDCQQKD